jgi:hypothetical protein
MNDQQFILSLFPSLPGRGGRAIKKMIPFRKGADGVVAHKSHFAMRSETCRLSDHPLCFALPRSRSAPVCGASVASRLLIDAAATPPWQGGENASTKQLADRFLALFVLLVSLTFPAFSQTAGAFNASPGLDLTGNWQTVVHEDQPERGPGPELVDYAGLPITDGARQFALSWDAGRLTVPEHQCRVHIVSYIYRGPLNLRIWEEKDPQSQRLIAIKQYISTYEQWRTIWMDGRPHPPEEAPHTFMGFSTGKWEGSTLTVQTTHIKQGWIRRNGLPESDKATLTEHYLRHGDFFTHVVIINDPVYLTQPLIKTQTFRLNVQEGQNWLYPCDPVVEVDRPADSVPNYLPGENPFLHEFADKHHVPVEAALGGAETMYPEYQQKIKK